MMFPVFPRFINSRAHGQLRWWAGLMSAAVMVAVADAEEPIRYVADFWAMPVPLREEVHPVEMEMQLIYHDPNWGVTQIRNGSTFEFMQVEGELAARSGDVVRVTGTTTGNADTFGVKIGSVEMMGHQPIEAAPMHPGQGNDAVFSDRMVSFEAYVESQDLVDARHLRLQLVAGGAAVRGWVLLEDGEPVSQWAGGWVEVRGVYAPKTDTRGQLLRRELWCARSDWVEWKGALEERPEYQQEVRPIGVMAVEVPDRGTGVRVRGEFVGGGNERVFLVQDASGRARVETAQMGRPVEGEVIEVWGQPSVEGVDIFIRNAIWWPTGEAVASAGKARREHRITATVMELSPRAAAAADPVTVRGLVTWVNEGSERFYLQDSSGGIAVRRPAGWEGALEMGQLVEVAGHTAQGEFAPEIVATAMVASSTGELPLAREVSRLQALSGLEEGQLVEMTGFVFAADATESGYDLGLSTATGEVAVRVTEPANGIWWLGAVVKVTGVCVAKVDGAGRLRDVEIRVARAEQIEVIDALRGAQFEMPATPLSELGRFNVSASLRYRLKVEGVVLWVGDEGRFVVHQDGETLWVQSRQSAPLRRGDRVEVVGFLGHDVGGQILREGVWRNLGTGVLPEPEELTLRQATSRVSEGHRVAVTGRVTERYLMEGTARLRLEDEGRVLWAEVAEQPVAETWRSLVPKEARLEVVGLVARPVRGNERSAEMRLLVSEWNDVRVVAAAPWWTRERILGGGVMVVGLAGLILIWVGVLRRQVNRQTREIAMQAERAQALREELQSTRRMESLGSLAEGVTRDFGQLLRRIHEQVAAVLSSERLTWQNRERLDQTQAAVLRAQDLMRRLEAFSPEGPSTGELLDWGRFVQHEVTNFEVGPLVKRMVNIAPGLPRVEVDSGMMRQVLHNILRNAVQAMPDGGTLTIDLDGAVPPASVAVSAQPKRHLRLRIMDSGEGIAADDLNRVCDPYFTRRAGAQGLGLAVAYATVRQYGGQLEITSPEGQGTTVTLWLPAATVG